MSQNDNLDHIDKALVGLIEIEDEMDRAERAAEIARLKSVQQIFLKRSKHIQKIDKFWHIVLSQHPEFAELIRSDDFKYLELIKDIYVHWDAVDSTDDSIDPGNYSITFKFDSSGPDGDFPEQEITKRFSVEKVDPEDIVNEQTSKKHDLVEDDDLDLATTERLVSSNVDIIWPKFYDSINPSKINDKKTPQGKKNYRSGMKSFFGWFKWTGRKPGKEFPNGDELAKLIAEDVFPNAVRYYTEAQRDGLDEELDSDSSEPLDLSDDETTAVRSTSGLKRKLEED